MPFMKINIILFTLTLLTSVLFAQNNAQFISQTVPSTLTAGEEFNVSIVMKNTGTTTWSTANSYRLGSQTPTDNTNWGATRITLPAGNVAPNEQVTITATLTAPLNQNPGNFQWKMVQDGVEWFGQQTELVEITIPDAVVDNAQFISQTVPTTVQSNQTFNVQLTFKNIGTTTWLENEEIRLGSKSPDNNSIWGVNRMYLSSDVAPNEEVTFSVNLTAPANSLFYNFQWQMEREGYGWFGDLSEIKQIPVINTSNDSLLASTNSFTVDNNIVATSFFTWYAQNAGQQLGPWIPINGRESWTGDVELWKRMIKQTMMANIDILYVELIPYMEDKRGNLFIALSELRHEGWNVPKICPFLDPLITYNIAGQNGDCSTDAGKDELISHYIRFYKQYYSVNTDQFADDYIYTQDGSPVLNIWHIYVAEQNLGIHNSDQLSRNDITNRLSSEFGTEHPIFNNDIKMINNAISEPHFSFADERVHQFEVHEYFVTKINYGIRSAQVKPGYWDMNVRTPGYLLPRDGGSHYITAWNNVNTDASISRVYIESFNEYDEGSGIFAAKTDTIYKKTDGGINNTGDDTWSSTNDPYEYIKTTALGAAEFNDSEQLNAKILWNNIPNTMNLGESFTATIVVRNEGNEQWNNTNNFKLGQNENIDNTIFGTGRYSIDDSTNEIPEYGGIFRGRTITFNITITAPTTMGIYTTSWQMLQEGIAWFGDTLQVEISVGTTNITNIENNKFSVSPNPAKNNIHISTNTNTNNEYTIYNTAGKIVYNTSNKSKEFTISVANLEKGTYFIKSDNFTQKLIKL